MMSASTSRCPGTSRPRRMRSRIHSTTALDETTSLFPPDAAFAGEETLPREAARVGMVGMGADNIIPDAASKQGAG